MELVGALPFFKLGPWTPIPGADWLQFHAFGMFVAIGLIVCLVMATRRGEQKLGMDGEKVQNYGLFLIVVGWIFAHVFNVLFYHPTKAFEMVQVGGALSLPRIFVIWGSVSSYGGLLGGIIAVWLWKRLHPDDDFLLWVDHATWTLTFAWMFGRLGCSSVHDHLGATASDSWPLAFEIEAADWHAIGVNVAENFETTFRHDLGFYEFLWWIVIVATVLILDRVPRKKGIYTVVVPLMYAPVRFFLDFFRLWPLPEDGEYDVPAHTQWFLDLFGIRPETIVFYENYHYPITAPLDQYQNLPPDFFNQAQTYLGDTRHFGLTPAQYFSIGLFVLGIVMWFRIRDNEVVEWREFDPGTRARTGDNTDGD